MNLKHLRFDTQRSANLILFFFCNEKLAKCGEIGTSGNSTCQGLMLVKIYREKYME